MLWKNHALKYLNYKLTHARQVAAGTHMFTTLQAYIDTLEISNISIERKSY
jgi:hypothetical protein